MIAMRKLCKFNRRYEHKDSEENLTSRGPIIPTLRRLIDAVTGVLIFHVYVGRLRADSALAAK